MIATSPTVRNMPGFSGFEMWLAGAVVLLAIVLPYLGFRGRRRRLQLSPTAVILLSGVAAFAGSALYSLFVLFPVPRIHDEFSYLLAADTFAAGRLTNPTHPMWRFFETFHVFHEPTYASKYPPAQGWFLGAGQLLSGDPIVGVWLSSAFACAAISWMLHVWLPRRWAIWGSALVVVRIGVVGYWSQSYWGGYVAAGSAALVFGALRSMLDEPRIGAAAVFGLGVFLLANSRPFEGFIIMLPCAALLSYWAVQRIRTKEYSQLAAVTAPAAVALIALAAWTLFYNKTLTGNPLKFPHIHHEEKYGTVSEFLWQEKKSAVEYEHAQIERLHKNWFQKFFSDQLTAGGFAKAAFEKARYLLIFHLGWVGCLPLVALPFALKNRWVLFAAVSCAFLFINHALVAQFFPHYAAPMTALIYLLMVQSMRVLHVQHWLGQRRAELLPSLILLACVISLAKFVAFPEWNAAGQWQYGRARINQDLEEMPGEHLVFVRYGPKHSVHQEWVYNRADIDKAKVVWARFVSAERNEELIGYFWFG